jgi:signal transduction histidine kinase
MDLGNPQLLLAKIHAMRIPRVSLKWNWSWGFGLFIALPALALALLGLRAVRADRIERQQQLREQQTQVARLIDAAISNRLGALVVELRQVGSRNADANNENSSGAYIFSLERDNVLKFSNQRVYFGEQTTAVWPASTENLIDQAQAAKAQGRNLEALNLYRRIIEVEPKLSAWAQLSIAAIKRDAGDNAAMDALSDAKLANFESTTPTGLPVALIACAYIERLPAEEQSRFALLFERTIENLRAGRWWLSYDERSFYDRQLRQMIEKIEAKRLPENGALKNLAAIEQVVRRSSPRASNEAVPSFERAQGDSFLITWLKRESDSGTYAGFAIPQAGLASLFDSLLSPLLSSQPFSVEVRDAQGHSVWGKLQTNAAHTEQLRGVRGLELGFSGLNGAGWLDQKQLLSLGFVILLLIMMIAGLAMTARAVRREVELGRIQNDFIAAMSHEFKSPIASIRLLMERITSGRLSTTQTRAEYYAAISREAERLERLVNRLLEWQQIQAGRKRYNFSSGSLAEIATTAIAQMRPQAEAKGISIETEAGAVIPEVPLDEAAITDAIENLIDNAIKYSPPQTQVKLLIRLDDGHACLEVRDQGIGIEPDELSRIFDKFYRGRRGDLRNVHGTGLGLALVKATMEAHGGAVDVTSEPGAGSCFRLRLPINNGVSNDGTNPDS